MVDPDALSSSQSLLQAYRAGWFPMIVRRPADPAGLGAIGWCSPNPRAVLPIPIKRRRATECAFHVPRTLAKAVLSRSFEVTCDEAFAEVMQACARSDTLDPHTWIDDRMVAAYSRLHAEGRAHSIEVWMPLARGNSQPYRAMSQERHLVGGLYGVSIGGAFFGESMFTAVAQGVSNSSKVALVHLAYHLVRCGFKLHDVQFVNPHLRQFGCFEVSRQQYIEWLEAAIAYPATWEIFDDDFAISELTSTESN